MKRTKPISSWIGLRGELSRRALLDVGTSALNSAPIIVGVMGPLFLGVVAMLAAPLLYAATLPLPDGFALFAAHTSIAAIPFFMMRQRVLPDSVVAWAAGLPVQLRHRIIGDAWATTILVAPLFGTYLVSSLVWFWQWPPWLRPVWIAAIGAILVSTIATWLIGMSMLSMRSRPDRATRRETVSVTPQATGMAWNETAEQWSRDLVVAHYLLLKPQWRRKTFVWRVGHPSLIVFAGACMMGIPLFKHDAYAWQSALAPLAATLYVGVILWRDALMQENLTHLRREVSGWPVSFGHLNVVSRTWAVMPTTFLSLFPLAAVYWNSSPHDVRVPLWYAVIGLVGSPTMLAITKAWSRNRWAAAVVLVVALAICGGFL